MLAMFCSDAAPRRRVPKVPRGTHCQRGRMLPITLIRGRRRSRPDQQSGDVAAPWAAGAGPCMVGGPERTGGRAAMPSIRAGTAGAALWGLAIGAMITAMAPGAAADEPIYKGKRLSVLVNFAAGGPTDIEGRLFAKHIARHIDGQPATI